MTLTERVITEARGAVRALRRNAVLSTIMVLTLALGLGANTTVFSLVKSVLFVDADFGRNTGRLVSFHSVHPSRAQQLDDADLSWPEFETLRGSSPGIQKIEGYVLRNFTLSSEDGASRVSGASITPDLFSLLDTRPALGRGFSEADARDFGFEESVILSDAFWRREFGADPSIVGRSVQLNGRSVGVIGIMPRGFAFPERQELWLAYAPTAAQAASVHFVNAVGLLAPGESQQSVALRLPPLSADLQRRLGEPQRNYELKVARFPMAMVGDTRRAMTAMLISVVLVLLIGCANLAALLMSRAMERRREQALKSALGASRGSLVRESLGEVLLVSLIGSLLGWGFAHSAVPRLVSSFPEAPPYWMRFDVDGGAFAYCIALTLLTTFVAGLLPALKSASVDAGPDLKDGARSVSRSARSRFIMEGIVAGQVAACLALVVAAQLMIQSFNNLQAARSGVREDGLLTARLYLSGDEVDPVKAKAAALARLIEGIETRPLVARAAITTAIPADDGGPTAMLVKDVSTPERDEIPATVIGGSEGLFETLGSGLLRGRSFTRAEFEDATATSVIVSAALAAAIAPGGDVVGKSIAIRGEATHDWRTIVGVAPDVQYEEFGEETRAGRRAMYVPYARLGWRSLDVVARTNGPSDALIAEIRSIALRAYPGIAIFETRTMAQVRASTTWEQRFFSRTMGLFAAAAMVLAGLGLYGVLRQFVGSRTHEIGVRRALGASAGSIASLVIVRAAAVTGLGVAVGVWLSAMAARGLAGLLFGTNGMSPDTIAVAATALGGLVLVCCLIPVRRAMKVDPIVTLRQE